MVLLRNISLVAMIVLLIMTGNGAALLKYFVIRLTFFNILHIICIIFVVNFAFYYTYVTLSFLQVVQA